MKNKLILLTLSNLMIFIDAVYAAGYYYYDDDGNLIKMVYSNGNYVEYTYDSHGNETSQTSYDSSGNLIGNSHRGYTYNDDGKMTSVVYYDSNGAMQSRYEYGWENGKQTSHTSYNSSNTMTGKTVYQYDSDGNKISTTAYFSEAALNSGNYNYKYEYTYDNQGNQISETYTGRGGYSGNRKQDREYDDNGNILSIVNYEDGTLSSKFEYAYDENGKMTLNMDYDCRTGNCFLNQKYEYAYNNEGDEISYKYYECSAENCQLVERSNSEYEYDKKGNVIKFSSFSYDGEGNVTYKSNYTMLYDRYGNLINESGGSYDCEGDECSVDEEYEDVKNYSAGYINKQWLQNRKLIYTVEEATKLSKPIGNKIMVRYK